MTAKSSLERQFQDILDRAKKEAARDAYAQGFADGAAAKQKELEQLLETAAESTGIAKDSIPATEEERLSADLEALGLKSRTYYSLVRNGIHTVGALCEQSAPDLLDIPGFGPGALSDVEYCLRQWDLQLKES